MKHSFVLIWSVLLVVCMSLPGNVMAAAAANEPLPDITLTVPDNDSYRTYLGLKGEPGEQFKLEEVEADILLIQLFSMYCPFCQEEAHNVNALYQSMLAFSRPGLMVKIIGLGANNSEFEVDHFRKTYSVEFPLFPDQDMSMYNALGGKGTPGFIGCRKDAENQYTIILRQSGGFYHPDEFLNELLRKGGIN